MVQEFPSEANFFLSGFNSRVSSKEQDQLNRRPNSNVLLMLLSVTTDGLDKLRGVKEEAIAIVANGRADDKIFVSTLEE